MKMTAQELKIQGAAKEATKEEEATEEKEQKYDCGEDSSRVKGTGRAGGEAIQEEQ
jgi:hypothetical protein